MSIAHMTEDLSYLVFFKDPTTAADPREILYASTVDFSAGLLAIATLQPNRLENVLSYTMISHGVGLNYGFELSDDASVPHSQFFDWLNPSTLQMEEVSEGVRPIDLRTRSALISLPETHFRCTNN